MATEPSEAEDQEAPEALERPEGLLLGVIDDETEEVATGRGQPAAASRLSTVTCQPTLLRGAILPRPGPVLQAPARYPRGERR